MHPFRNHNLCNVKKLICIRFLPNLKHVVNTILALDFILNNYILVKKRVSIVFCIRGTHVCLLLQKFLHILIFGNFYRNKSNFKDSQLKKSGRLKKFFQTFPLFSVSYCFNVNFTFLLYKPMNGRRLGLPKCQSFFNSIFILRILR